MGHELEVLNFDVICKKRDRLGTQREQKTKHKVYVISYVVDEIELK